MSVGTELGETAALEQLSAAVEHARRSAALRVPDEVWTCPDAAVEALLLMHAQLESVTAAIGHLVVRDADVRDLASKDGQASTTSWLTKKLTLTPGEAKARVTTADMLSRKAVDTAAALREGRINADQARAIARGLTRIETLASPEEFAEAEAFLLQDGIGLHAGHITRLARHIEAVLDPDGAQPKDKVRLRRGLTVTDIGGGLHQIRGTLTDECAAYLKAALDPLAAPRPATKGPNGEAGGRDERAPAQRNHDALQEMTQQFLRFGKLPDRHGVRPHLTVIAAVETMRGDLGHPFARTTTGEDFDIATLRRIACDAGITPLVANTLGEPLAVGRESRTATPAQWRALVARDVGCIGEACTRPASWCEAHHFPEWGHDGRTDIDKLALLCSHDHYLVHHEGWQVRMAADGHPEMIPPAWVDPDQRPRRNAHWKLLRDGLKRPPHPANADPAP